MCQYNFRNPRHPEPKKVSDVIKSDTFTNRFQTILLQLLAKKPGIKLTYKKVYFIEGGIAKWIIQGNLVEKVL